MSIVQKLTGAGLIAASALAITATAQAAPTAAPPQHNNSCFQLSDWEGWHAASPDVLYLRVRISDVYRVDLSHGTAMLQDPFVHLVSKSFGGDSICDPIDLNLAVSDGHGFSEPLFLKAITKLTPEQVAALPRKDRP